MKKSNLIFLLLLGISVACNQEPTGTSEAPVQTVQDPLPSWNESESRSAIISFVESVTDENDPAYVPPEDRIATFDNDGTLWSEQPVYFQLMFGMDMVRQMAASNPEMANDPTMKAAIDGDIMGVMEGGMDALFKIIFMSHAEMTTDEFNRYSKIWLDTARHPVTKKKYTEMVYQPMLELIDYLEVNEFKVFIVSGGGIEFIRAFAPEVYGIPSERIVGSSLNMKFNVDANGATISRLPEIGFVDDGPGKPIGIQSHIGKRPIAAFGNSDGDLQMLQWAESGEGKRLMAYVHHTDSVREYAYDRGSHIGGFDAGLDSAQNRGWPFIDMKNDWSKIYP